MRKCNLYNLGFILLACILLTGCDTSKKKKERREDYAFCEHIVSIGSIVGEDSMQSVLPDEAGFIPVKDIVYVNTDSLIIRQEASNESALVAAVDYGTQLTRTGIGQGEWDRVEYQGETCFLGHELVTTVPIQPDKQSEYSTAVLTIVETKHKQYSYDDMCADLKEMHETYSDKMKLNIIGTSLDNRNIFEVTIGTDQAKKDIYLVAGVCGAEYMTSLVLMKQIEYYLHYYDAGFFQGYAYADLFDNVRVHVIPMLNPDSVEISQHYLSGMRLEKIVLHLKEWYDRDQLSGGINVNLDNYLLFFFANAQGVDLRKNFPYQWDLASTNAFPGSKDYRGAAAGSEAETKAIIHALKTVDPDVVLTFHTTGSRMLCNYGQSETLLNEVKQYGYYLGKLMTYELNDSKVNEEGYGTLTGYCNNVLGIPALEVHMGNGSAPLSSNEFNAIWNACLDSWAALQVKLIDW